jgi:hypothetical protein
MLIVPCVCCTTLEKLRPLSHPAPTRCLVVFSMRRILFLFVVKRTEKNCVGHWPASHAAACSIIITPAIVRPPSNLILRVATAARKFRRPRAHTTQTSN